jgi:serine/threonine protein kinase
MQLGEGTTSKVYLGFLDKDPSKPVAIKIFKPEFLLSGEKAPEIFRNEIKALLSLDHPNIVKVYEYGVVGRIILYQSSSKSVQVLEENLWFLCLEFVSQCTLADLIKENGGYLFEENAGLFFI